MDKFVTPVLPKGRGAGLVHAVDTSNVTQFGPVSSDTGLGQSPSFIPIGRGVGDMPQVSTPIRDRIGESIVTKLLSAGVVNLTGDSQTQTEQCNYVPHVTVHVKPNKELQIFRSDGTDRCSQEVPIDGQADEIISRLMGKARDVVRVALRSDPGLDVKQKPDLVFGVLRHYFNDSSLCLPLADFYATLPTRGENPVDYWIRLNKAAELAIEGLRRLGQTATPLTHEVACMFVKHCPDPELSYVFKCKPVHEWTARDVQQRTDDYQREVRANGRASGAAQLKGCNSTITAVHPNASPAAAAPEGCSRSFSPPSSGFQGLVNSFPSTATREPLIGSPSFSPSTAVSQNLQQSEERLMGQMVDMFQAMMERMQHHNTQRPRRGVFNQFSRNGRRREDACRVCSDPRHTTASHCLSDKLCFSCFAPGHVRLSCPASTSTQIQPEGN
ncbi:microtubule-associated protein, RP/EB family [Sarotherodon galilaeus]